MKIVFVLAMIVFLLFPISTSLAYEDIDNFISWEKIATVYTRANTTLLILKNPVQGEIIYAIVEVSVDFIPYYVLIGDDMRRFIYDFDSYKELELSPQRKKAIRRILWIVVGATNI